MNILLTGATGFVGRSLVKLFSEKTSFNVVAISRVAQYELLPKVRYVNIPNIETHNDWGHITAGCDVIVHLAGRAHVLQDSSTDPLAEFRAVNVHATLTLARQAMLAGVKRFIFISSIGVNGSHTTGEPFDEKAVVAPHANYALSKLEAEQGLRELVQDSDMELVIIRPPLVYAGHAPGNFQRLLKLVASGIPLPFSLVHNRRSMVALENLVSFICLCIEHPAAANELFLISDGVDVSTPEIISNLAKGMGRRAYLWPLPDSVMCMGASLLGRQALYSQLCGSLTIDSSKARNLLGWLPPSSPADALQKAGCDYIASNIVRA